MNLFKLSKLIRVASIAAVMAIVLTTAAWAALDAGGRHFGHDGAVVARQNGLHSGQATIVDRQGRIVVAALDDSEPSRQRTLVTRLLRGGRFDRGFARNGVSATLPLTEPAALAFDGSGGIFLAGSSARTETTSAGASLAVAHLRRDGSLDRGFGDNGVAIFDAGSDEERALAVRASGGGVRVVGASQHPSEPEVDLTVAQLTSRGELDPRFSGDGLRQVPAAGLARLVVAFDRRDRIVAAGDLIGEAPAHPAFPHPRLLRFMPNGSPDTGFGDGGVAAPRALDRFGGKVTDLALDRRGRALVTLAQRRQSREFLVFRTHPGGALDRGFANGGILAAGLRGKRASAAAVTTDSRGRIVVVGSAQDRDLFAFRQFAALRLRPDGTPDRSFGHRGFNNLQIGGGSSAAWAITPYGRRGVVAVGDGGGVVNRQTALAVVRYP